MNTTSINIRSGWRKISYFGVYEANNSLINKRIKLTNRFTCLAIAAFVFSGLNNFSLHQPASAIALEVCALLLLLVFIFNSNKNYALATSTLFVVINLSLFYFSSYTGVNGGVNFYYFPLMLGIAFLFDFRKRTVVLTHFVISLVMLVLLQLTDNRLFIDNSLTPETLSQMYKYNLITSILIIGFFVYLYVSFSIEQNKILLQRIEDRRLSEQNIQKALNEKEILLTEVHHRVKNNLAVIVGLFNLKVNSVNNPEAREILNECSNRVRSMALVHNKLYTSTAFDNIDFGAYIKDLAEEIKSSYPTQTYNIKVDVNIYDFKLNINAAIPCGLILNEVLTNCYKHAFDSLSKGEIYIALNKTEKNLLQLLVSDNGKGIKEDFKNKDTLGMVVIDALTNQLSGEYSYTNNNGTCFNLEFKPDVLL